MTYSPGKTQPYNYLRIITLLFQSMVALSVFGICFGCSPFGFRYTLMSEKELTSGRYMCSDYFLGSEMYRSAKYFLVGVYNDAKLTVYKVDIGRYGNLSEPLVPIYSAHGDSIKYFALESDSSTPIYYKYNNTFTYAGRELSCKKCEDPDIAVTVKNYIRGQKHDTISALVSAMDAYLTEINTKLSDNDIQDIECEYAMLNKYPPCDFDAATDAFIDRLRLGKLGKNQCSGLSVKTHEWLSADWDITSLQQKRNLLISIGEDSLYNLYKTRKAECSLYKLYCDAAIFYSIAFYTRRPNNLINVKHFIVKRVNDTYTIEYSKEIIPKSPKEIVESIETIRQKYPCK